MRLHIGSKNMNIKGYLNANWTSNVEDRRSTSIYIFYIEEGIASWNTNGSTFYHGNEIHGNEPMHEVGHLAWATNIGCRLSIKGGHDHHVL